ncbi:MAG: 2-C-methyl-D-erythritol 4-phosphate cytidylyltransferase [Bacteroidales bacterium]|nr:2-C-methyl-D-erythritol 4-phosphate cytidylyltransferase [Bacteroidales bacterium]
MKQYAIIVAGGSGKRMNSNLPKQFLKINNKVILMESIRVFYEYNSSIEIIVALPKNQIEYWKDLCKKHNFKIKHKIVNGGETRFQTVKNAISKINTESIVAIHDAVRPLVSIDTISECFKIAEQKSSAIPYINILDSIRFVENNSNKAVDRSKYKLLQTPQTFYAKYIIDAYKEAFNETFTDDASVAESCGIKINLIKGNRENIKITNSVDLIIATALSDYLDE